MSTAIRYNVLAQANTEQWRVLRHTGIGASESAAAAGVSEWKTPLDIFCEKRGEVAQVEQTDAMRLGHLLEPVVEAEFLRRTGMVAVLSPCGFMRHKECEHVFATPDAILSGASGDEVGEWKTTTWRQAAKLGAEDTDDIPVEWLCQVQQEMAVTDLAVAHVAVLLDGRTLKTYRVERSPELIEQLIAAETELWERIENNDPPEPNWEHPRTHDLIRRLHGSVDGGLIVLSDEISACWDQYETLGQQIKDLESRRKMDLARVLHAIGDNYAGILQGGERIVRRKRIEATEISYTRGTYIDVRAVKAGKGK